MVTMLSCSWCHLVNDVPRGVSVVQLRSYEVAIACRGCGHWVGVPRRLCRCERCAPGLFSAEGLAGGRLAVDERR